MKTYIGSDHAGYDLKESVKKYLLKKGYQIEDCGTHSTDSVDYPLFAKKVAAAVAAKKTNVGILICGSGIGMSMAANKVKKIRAAACESEYTAKMSRLHNDSNILCIGSRILSKDKAIKIVNIWLNTQFEGGRHLRRVKAIR